MTEPIKIGIIGCGNITRQYFPGAENAPNVTIKACADIFEEAAKAKAEEYGVEAKSVDDLLADPEIELVVNLTIPQAHKEIAIKTLEAGKHTYSEKPFALSIEDGAEILAKGKETGLRVGCAPDTFLGAGIQTSIKCINDGLIGQPFGGSVALLCAGHESWHPNPGFYYLEGGGPMLDMGPYYITALINMLGPVKQVCGVASKAFEERICTCEARKGEVLPVEVPTHYSSTLQFHSGAVVTVQMSFDTRAATLTPFQIWGTKGSMTVTDPNQFKGNPQVFTTADGEWREIPVQFAENARMYGVVDMVEAIRNNRPHRVSGELAQHVLEVMLACRKSSEDNAFITIHNQCEKPAPLTPGMLPWAID